MDRWRGWIWPGILTVAILSALALWLEAGRIESDVGNGAERRLAAAGLGWAAVEVDGRDVTVVGTAPLEGLEAAALEAARDEHAVRAADARLSLLAARSPYRFGAMRDGERVVLEGYVPDEGVRAEIVAAAKAAFPEAEIEDRMELARGAPAALSARTAFGFAQIAATLDGRFDIVDEAYSVSGRARDLDAYDDIAAGLAALPEGLVLAEKGVSPPTVSPYTVRADYDGAALNLSGFAPDADARAVVQTAAAEALPGVAIDSRIRIAAGAPEGYADQVAAALAALSRLSSGNASLSDGTLTVGGTALDGTAYEELIATLNGDLPGGATLGRLDLAPPTVSPYTTELRLEGGGVRLSGFAPSSDARAAAEDAVRRALPDAETVNELQIAAGAPASHGAQIKALSAVLPALETGRIVLSDAVVTIDGAARTPESFETAVTLLENSLPEGTTLASRNVTAPDASPYTTNMEYDGSQLRLTGFAPNRNARAAVEAAVRNLLPGAVIANELRIASGAPEAFREQVELALSIMPRLSNGSVSLSDGRLSASGTALSSADFEAVTAALSGDLPGDVRLTALDVRPPVASPYTTGLSLDGSTARLTGFAPSIESREGIARALAEKLPNVEVDNAIEIAAGPPEGFGAQIAVAVDLLSSLSEGEIALRDGAFSVRGTARTGAEFEAALERLRELPGEATLASNELRPPLAQTYRTGIAYDGRSATLSGLAPDIATRTAIEAAVRDRLPEARIDNGYTIAAGAPTDLLERLQTGLDYVADLSEARIDLENGRLTVSGRARDPEAYDRALARAEGAGPNDAIAIAPAMVEDYRFGVDYDGTALALTGYAPNLAGRARIAMLAAERLPGATVENRVLVATGAPDGFDAQVMAALDYLPQLERGTISVNGDGIAVRGVARTSADFERLARDPSAEVTPPEVGTYAFGADYADGEVTLRGFVPDHATREAVTAAARTVLPDAEVLDRLKFAAGAPENFNENATAALAPLARLDTGTIDLDGRSLRVRGRAASVDGYERTLAELEAADGGDLAIRAEIAPAEVSPYTFAASRDDAAITLTGYVPSEGQRAEIAAAAGAGGAEVVDELRIAAGAPIGHEARVARALAFLQHVEAGSARIEGERLIVDGRARDVSAYRTALDAAGKADTRGVLPAFVSPYRFEASIDRSSGSPVVTLDGYVSDEAGRTALIGVVREAVDGTRIVDRLDYADGAPDGFEARMREAVATVARLEEGRVRLEGEGRTVFGRARTSDDFAALAGIGELVPPASVGPYETRIERDGTSFVLSGAVPSIAARDALIGSVGKLASDASVEDRTQFATGAPEGRESVLERAIDLLRAVRRGTAVIVGTTLNVEGEAGSVASFENAQKLAAAGGESEKIAIAPAFVSPYSWSATEREDGLVLDGFVPSQTERTRVLAAADGLTEGVVDDRMRIAAGAPEAFVDMVDAVLAEFSTLDRAAASLVGTRLSLRGAATDEATRDASVARLTNALGDRFQVNLSLSVPPPVRETPATAEPELEAVRDTSAISEAEGPAPTDVGQQPPTEDAETPRLRDAPAEVARETDTPPQPPAEREPVEEYVEPSEPDGVEPPAVEATAEDEGQADAPIAESTPLIATDVVPEKIAEAEATPNAAETVDPVPDVPVSEPAAPAVSAEPVPPVREAPEVALATPEPSIEPATCDVDFAALFEGDNILFATNRALIRQISYPLLDRIAAAKKRCADASFRITGHTDSRGTRRYNRRLSAARAEAVRRYMVEAGVPAESLEAVGAGEDTPIDTNRTRAGRQTNRRIEFTIIE